MLAGTLVLIKLVELFEAVTVDDFLETAVVVVVQVRLETSDFHQYAILLGVRMPTNEHQRASGVGIAVVRELRPDVAHRVSPVFCCLERVG